VFTLPQADTPFETGYNIDDEPDDDDTDEGEGPIADDDNFLAAAH